MWCDLMNLGTSQWVVIPMFWLSNVLNYLMWSVFYVFPRRTPNFYWSCTTEECGSNHTGWFLSIRYHFAVLFMLNNNFSFYRRFYGIVLQSLKVRQHVHCSTLFHQLRYSLYQGKKKKKEKKEWEDGLKLSEN